MSFESALNRLTDTKFWKRVGLVLTGFLLTDVAAENLMDLLPQVPFQHTAASAGVTAAVYTVAPQGSVRNNVTLGAGLGTASNFLEETGLNTVIENMGVKLRSPIS